MVQPYYSRGSRAVEESYIDEFERMRDELDLAFQGVYDEDMVLDIGGAGINYIHFTANPVQDDSVTINGIVYMFDPSGGSPYDVAVILGGSPGANASNLRDSINADAGAEVDANAQNAMCLLIDKTGGADSDFSLAESTGGARMVDGKGTATGAKDAVRRRIVTAMYSFTANDITALAAGEQVPIFGVPADEAPEVGSALAFRGTSLLPFTSAISAHTNQANSNFYILSVGDSGAVFQAGDFILVLVWI